MPTCDRKGIVGFCGGALPQWSRTLKLLASAMPQPLQLKIQLNAGAICLVET